MELNGLKIHSILLATVSLSLNSSFNLSIRCYSCLFVCTYVGIEKDGSPLTDGY